MKGFSIIEMMVAMVLTLVVTATMTGNINFQKRTFTEGAIRSRVNQNLRGALDILGTDIRIGGENLPMGFPAILISDGASDELYVRRALLDEALPVCQDITGGALNPTIIVADDTSLTPGCTVSGIETAFGRWDDYRIAQGGTIRAYAYNIATREGEYFIVDNQINNGSDLTLSNGGTTAFTNTYPAGTSVIYILEEWRYRLQDDELQVIQDGDTGQPLSVMFGVQSFSITAALQDDTTVTSLDADDSWTEIKFIEVAITGEESKPGGVIERSVVSRFFPRNILSF